MNVDPNHRLSGVHSDLVKVVRRAAELSPVDFVVTEGLRTMEKQRALVARGASQTLKSRHLTGHAVDVAAFIDVDGDGRAGPKEIRWDWPLYAQIAAAFKRAAKELNVPIEWGGDWASLKDGPHFQLPWKAYP